jgi:hypothetical protein
MSRKKKYTVAEMICQSSFNTIAIIAVGKGKAAIIEKEVSAHLELAVH